MLYLRVSDIALRAVVDSFDIQLPLWKVLNQPEFRPAENTHNIPLFVFNGVLHPKHVTVFTANFIRPPIVGVAICTVLV